MFQRGATDDSRAPVKRQLDSDDPYTSQDSAAPAKRRKKEEEDRQYKATIQKSLSDIATHYIANTGPSAASTVTGPMQHQQDMYDTWATCMAMKLRQADKRKAQIFMIEMDTQALKLLNDESF